MQEVEEEKLKKLFNFLIPDWWMLVFFPHRETIFKDLKKAKKMLEELGI